MSTTVEDSIGVGPTPTCVRSTLRAGPRIGPERSGTKSSGSICEVATSLLPTRGVHFSPTLTCSARSGIQTEQGLAGRRSGRPQLGQRIGIYCRVSTADQSCERQERDLTAFAARADYEVVGVFKETGSARSSIAPSGAR
jgi:Resolvase, N terminal domain